MGLWYLQETVADPPLEKARAIELDRSGEMEQRLVIRTKVSEMFHKSAEQDSFVWVYQDIRSFYYHPELFRISEVAS